VTVSPPPVTDAARQDLLACARGDLTCDLVLSGGRIVNVFSQEVIEADIGIRGGLIAGMGQYRGRTTIDLRGRYICPGLIEGHIHIESSLLTPHQFARAVVPRGTTAVVCDPHEITNVLGETGLRHMLEMGQDLPLDIFPMIPSCVPATHMETSGARLDARSIAPLLDLEGVPGLAEMMNYPGTVTGDPEILARIGAALDRGLVADGHAPGLTGPELQAYCTAGVDSDHECTTLEEAREKLRAGMYIFIREGSTARNLEALLPLVRPETAHRFLLVSDDRHPHDLLRHGHLDAILRKAVRLGMDPITALRLVTLNPAQRFGLHGRGAVAPGYLADLVVFDDLSRFTAERVFKNGREVASELQPTERFFPGAEERNEARENTIHIDRERIDFSIPARDGHIRVIDCQDDLLLTNEALLKPTVRQDLAVADPDRDLLKIAVIERHRASGRMGKGFVRGFGLKTGALASTVAHDSHNLIVLGTEDRFMEEAVRLVTQSGGGLALFTPGRTVTLPLPLAGLMSDMDLKEVSDRLDALDALARDAGIRISHPFMLLSFLALPVIPHLKITDYGLINVDRFTPVELWHRNSA